MKKEDFMEKVKNSVIEKLGKEYQVTVCKSDKNNGVVYTGLRIQKNGFSVAPLIYLDEHFKQYKNGNTTLSSIVEYVIKESRKNSPNVDIRQFLTYENVKNNIVYRLINTERNQELLKDIPHMEFMDLSIVFRCLILENDFGQSSILIHNLHMKLWDVSVEELYQTAKENTQKLEGYEIKSMTDVLCEIMEEENLNKYASEECSERFSDDVPMYILSNKNRVEGASCMLHTDLIRNFANSIHSSLYIIPSSVHELLLVPTPNTDDGSAMKNMIKEINDTQVEPEEILSYSLYYYSREDDRISML